VSTVETFVTVIVIIAMIAFGALLIHQLNSQHGDRIASFRYGRTGIPAEGPPRKARDRRVGATGTGRRRGRRDRQDP
jgi:hypothetical protein